MAEYANLQSLSFCDLSFFFCYLSFLSSLFSILQNDTINENLFNLSSRHYEHYVRFYETTILKRKHDICYSCGSDPLACHCDGNRKVYRYEIDSQ